MVVVEVALIKVMVSSSTKEEHDKLNWSMLDKTSNYI